MDARQMQTGNWPVLILGDEDDPHTLAVRGRLKELGCPSEVMNIWQPFAPLSVIDSTDGCRQKYRSLWLRLKPRAESATEAELFVLRERKEFLVGLAGLCIPPERMINNPWAQDRARNKLLQLGIARKCGWATPRTIFGNDVTAVKVFANCTSEVIYKPITWLASQEGGVLYTSVVDPTRLDELRDVIERAPGIWQERVPKRWEYRVTVVGQVVFAVRIHSQEIRDAQLDWRRAQGNLRYERVDLPSDLLERILSTNAAMGLVFAAYDFIETPSGEIIFLEANPAGNWLWLEERLGIAVSAEIAGLLALT